MKKLLFLILPLIFLCACSTSPEEQHMIKLCSELADAGMPVDCRCAAKKYLSWLSESEKRELRSVGLIFPGYGWKVNSAYKEQMTMSILDKWRNATFECMN